MACARAFLGYIRYVRFLRSFVRVALAGAVVSFATGCTERSVSVGNASAGASGTGSGTTSGDGNASTGPATGTGVATAGGGGFIQPSDGGVCAQAAGRGWRCLPCDPARQDCPDDTKCTAWSNNGSTHWWNTNKCVPYPDAPRGIGEGCTVEGSPTTGVDDCDRGAICWYADPETLEGECVAFCTLDGSEYRCDDPSKTCAVLADGALPLCLDPCDPLAADACPAGRACVPVDYAQRTFVCIPAGTATAGAPCVDPVDCAPGHLCLSQTEVPGCIGDPGAGCCAPYCDPSQPGADDTCAGSFAEPGAACLPIDPEGTLPHEPPGVGVCALPP